MVCKVGVVRDTTEFKEEFVRVLNVDNSDGVAKESIGDIPTGFPNILGSPERVVGARGAGRNLAIGTEATFERVVVCRIAGERRGMVVESKLQTWTHWKIEKNRKPLLLRFLCSGRVLECSL